MNIFITGASGFIGGALARKLGPDHMVCGMARSETAAEKIRQVDAIPVHSDLQTVSETNLAGMEVVIHAAAFVEPWGTRQQFWEANVEGTRRMLKAAKAAGVRRFIHIGTEAVLFCGQDMVDIDESYPYPPTTPYLYSETKKEAEKLVLAANCPEMTTISIRPRLVWGPNDTTILPNLLELVDSGAFRWIEQGKLLSSTTHIDNLVHGVMCAMQAGQGGEAYFITDGKPHTMREFLTLLLATAGRTPSGKSAPGWLVRSAAWTFESIYKLFRIRKKPPVTRFAANVMSRTCTLRIDKAQVQLGYEPQISVQDGMAELGA